jgi:hypothetical protein
MGCCVLQRSMVEGARRSPRPVHRRDTLALRDSVLFARARGYQDWGARTSERTTIAPLLEEISSLSL